MTAKVWPLTTHAVSWLVLGLVGALLVGCSSPESYEKIQVELSASDADAQQNLGDQSGAEPTQVPKDYRKYYRQNPAWYSCFQDFECTTLLVPLDWDDPAGEQIGIALQRSRATGLRQGSLVLSPAMAGMSGTEFLALSQTFVSESVKEAYDLVGFDPRGTGRSEPIKCLTDMRWDAYVTNLPGPWAPASEQLETTTELTEACARNAGYLLPYVDSTSVARDLDVIRKFLGDSQLNYLGYSYGTVFGSKYAALFPGKVGRFILDSAIDPSLSDTQRAVEQAEGFERALRRFVAYCLDRADCPLQGGVEDGLATVSNFLDSLQGVPLNTADPLRPLTLSLAIRGLISPLYASSQWPVLIAALDQALNQGDGTQLLANADAYNRRDTDGTFADTSGQAQIAIGCLESRLSPSTVERDAFRNEIMTVAPTLGRWWPDNALQCARWPVPQVAAESLDVSAPGSEPIMVIGATGDPATPYEWSQSLAKQLDSGFLVTYDGDGHGAYGSSNQCITDTADQYLVSGIVPRDEVVC